MWTRFFCCLMFATSPLGASTMQPPARRAATSAKASTAPVGAAASKTNAPPRTVGDDRASEKQARQGRSRADIENMGAAEDAAWRRFAAARARETSGAEHYADGMRDPAATEPA